MSELRNGIDRHLTTDTLDGKTLSAIKQDAAYQAAVGFAANDTIRVNGIAEDDDYVVQPSDKLSVEKAACTKG